MAEVAVLTAEVSFGAGGGPEMAFAIAVLGTVATAVAAGISREMERRETRRELDRLRAAAEPVRIGAIRQVAQAAHALIRARIVYRDEPAANPREAYTSLLDISRGRVPEAEWSPTEATRIRAGIEHAARQFSAAIGAPLGELDLDIRGHAHDAVAELNEAADSLLSVTESANRRVTALWADDQDARRRSERALEGDVAVLRVHATAIVAHARSLMDAEALALAGRCEKDLA